MTNDAPDRLLLYFLPLRSRHGTIRDFVCVDRDVQKRESQHVWRLSSEGYAVLSESLDGRKRTLYLHREVVRPPVGFVVDHVNCDSLDNRRENLRLATPSQNNTNTRARSKSGYKGVYLHNGTRKFIAQISVNGRPRHLGCFNAAEEAAAAWNAASLALLGEFVRLNHLAESGYDLTREHEC